jgi:hypothetical protein
VTVEEFISRLDRAKRSGNGWMARCPAHEDRQASLSIGEGDDGRVLIRCHAGCATEGIVAAMGMTMADLFANTRTTPRDSRATLQHRPASPHSSTDSGVTGDDAGAVAGGTVTPLQPDREGLRACTLEAYAEAKGLPLDFLRSLGLADARYADGPAVRMPYVDSDGHEQAVRYRISLDGEDKFRWKKRSKLCLYGLTRLRSARDRGYVVLVEGESFTQTLWHHGFPALGIPGANNWKDDRDAPELDGISTVYVVIEPDKGGQTVLNWLKASLLTGGRKRPRSDDGPSEITLERVETLSGAVVDMWHEEPVQPADPPPLPKVNLLSFPDAKDVSDLYLQNPDSFADRFEGALRNANRTRSTRRSPPRFARRRRGRRRARSPWNGASSMSSLANSTAPASWGSVDCAS